MSESLNKYQEPGEFYRQKNKINSNIIIIPNKNECV